MGPFEKHPANFLSKIPHPGEKYEAEEETDCEWYEPREDSLPVNFCLDTSLHGLHYLGQRKRHICERAFWFIAVSLAIGVASYLIYEMFKSNKEMPIITVFTPTEMTIDEIPFPAVTICNVNNIQKSKFDNLMLRLSMAQVGQGPAEDIVPTLAAAIDIYDICEATNTFSENFDPSSTLGFYREVFANQLQGKRKEVESYANIGKTLMENSQSCEQMIRRCIWMNEIRNCSELFQEVITDNGYCCSFNWINTRKANTSQQNGEEWEDDLNYDSLIFTKDKANRKRPRRQRYPGRESGLSVLLDPDLNEILCTNMDSKGFAIGLHTSLDYPRIKDDGIAIPPAAEVLVKIRPQVALTDDSAKKFSKEQRNCYFGEDFALPNYNKYTTQNCLDECIAEQTKAQCGCVTYYMPHKSGKDLCKPKDYNCTITVRKNITKHGLGKACTFCFPTCVEIEYTSETTVLPVIEDKVERLFNTLSEKEKKRNGSIVHIYFGVDSTFPRLRTESSTINQLISNVGGILGLCLGFSVLSVLEIIYYLTIRVGCNWYRERITTRNTVEKFDYNNHFFGNRNLNLTKSSHFSHSNQEMLRANLPMFSTNYNSFRPFK